MNLYDDMQSDAELDASEAATFVPESIETIGKYHVQRVLASNLVADVYLGLDQDTQERVAIKMLRAPALRGLCEPPPKPPNESRENSSGIVDSATHSEAALTEENETDWFSSQASSSTAAARIAREWRLLRELNHPHIVRAREAGEHHGIPFLVMDYVPGGDLQAAISRSGRPPLDLALNWLWQTALALEAIHEKGIVHRDLKPSNLLVKSEHEICLGDFGIARSKSLNNDASSLTIPGSLLGTPDYIAPEQIECSTDADSRADLYSFGCLMFYLLYGQAPFSEYKGLSAKLSAHANEPVRFPKDRLRCNRDQQNRIEQLIRQLLAKSPADRPANIADVRAALQRIHSRDVGTNWPVSRRTLILAAAAAGLGFVGYQSRGLHSSARKWVDSWLERREHKSVQTSAFKLDLTLPGAPETLAADQSIRVLLESSRNCRVVLLRRGADGNVEVLLPNAFDGDTQLLAETPRWLPRPDDSWEMFLSPPFGEEHLTAVAVCGTAPSDWTEKAISRLIAAQAQGRDAALLESVISQLTTHVAPDQIARADLEITTAAS